MSDSLQPQVIDGPATLQPMTIDSALAGTFEKAMAMTEDPTVTSSPTPTASTPPQADPAPSLSPAEAKVLDLPDDGFIKVKVDGKEELLPVADYKAGVSREAHYTRRMQALAEQRRQAEEVIAAQYAQVQENARAVELAQAQLAQWVQQAQQQPQTSAPQAQAPDLGELATVGDVQAQLAQALSYIQQEQAAREQQMVSAIGQASQQVQEQVALQRDTVTYTNGLKAVLAKPDFDVLTKVVPFAEESIRYQVASMDPQSIQEALVYTEQVAKEWADRIRTQVLDAQTRQQVAAARAKLEPPVGSPPSPSHQGKPKSFMDLKSGKLDWDGLSQRAAALMS